MFLFLQQGQQFSSPHGRPQRQDKRSRVVIFPIRKEPRLYLLEPHQQGRTEGGLFFPGVVPRPGTLVIFRSSVGRKIGAPCRKNRGSVVEMRRNQTLIRSCSAPDFHRFCQHAVVAHAQYTTKHLFLSFALSLDLRS